MNEHEELKARCERLAPYEAQATQSEQKLNELNARLESVSTELSQLQDGTKSIEDDLKHQLQEEVTAREQSELDPARGFFFFFFAFSLFSKVLGGKKQPTGKKI